MSFPEQYRSQVLTAIQPIDLEKVVRATNILAEARDRGRHIFGCGNGGSATTGSHFVTDIVKGASYRREPRFRIMSRRRRRRADCGERARKFEEREVALRATRQERFLSARGNRNHSRTYDRRMMLVIGTSGMLLL